MIIGAEILPTLAADDDLEASVGIAVGFETSTAVGTGTKVPSNARTSPDATPDVEASSSPAAADVENFGVSFSVDDC